MTVGSSSVHAERFLDALTRETKQIADRRDERRYPSNTPAILEVVRAGSLVEILARVVDVSRNGLGLQVAEPLEVGSKVDVRFERLVVIGRVRWCHGLRAGILVDEIRSSHGH